MNYASTKNSIRSMGKTKRDSLEVEKPHALSGLLADFDKRNKSNDSDNLGNSLFDQILRDYDSSSPENGKEKDHLNEEDNVEKQGKVQVEGGNLFSYREIEEERQMREIKELIKQIKKEVELIKKADKALLDEVKDIEKLTINTFSEKPGIYHIRFLELVLKTLATLRAKIGESKTWMQALMSKKAKRGSLFAARTQKKGTQYSMSQELTNARSIQ